MSVLAMALLCCAPVVRPAPFSGARDGVTDVTLLGPFDGQVIDATTSEPIAGATCVGVWSYAAGDGFVAPHGSEMVEVVTDQAGRYRIPKAQSRIRGPTVRLVDFDLVVYRRGYVGYRSDTTYEGTARTDFTLRHNRIALRKWQRTDSHAQHLLFLAAPPPIERLVRWERELANVELYRVLGGSAPMPVPEVVAPEEEAGLRLLDATAVLTPDQVRLRTNFTGAFEVKDLEDLSRTHFYHGVHLEAVDRPEDWDVSVRVWKDPPGGLDPVSETIRATLPDVPRSAEVTAETWVLDGEDVRAVGFLDREQNVGVLLACRAMQCVDVETAIVLARFIHENLDALAYETPPDVRSREDGVPEGGEK
jgi:hypothetical protein